jgi:Zn-dependent membrane protease YugP
MLSFILILLLSFAAFSHFYLLRKIKAYTALLFITRFMPVINLQMLCKQFCNLHNVEPPVIQAGKTGYDAYSKIVTIGKTVLAQQSLLPLAQLLHEVAQWIQDKKYFSLKVLQSIMVFGNAFLTMAAILLAASLYSGVPYYMLLKITFSIFAATGVVLSLAVLCVEMHASAIAYNYLIACILLDADDLRFIERYYSYAIITYLMPLFYFSLWCLGVIAINFFN